MFLLNVISVLHVYSGVLNESNIETRVVVNDESKGGF